MHLATEPGVMLGRFLLLPHEDAHEVAQELRDVTVADLGCSEQPAGRKPL